MKKRTFLFDKNIDYSLAKLELNSFRETYTHIRAYHACKPLQIETYLSNGIKPITKASARNALNSLVTVSNKEVVLETFREEWKQHNSMHKKVWVCIDKEELLNESAHYLIYGSEFILEIASMLGLKNELKKIGTPTIFHCDIKISKISDYYLEGLIDIINYNSGSIAGFPLEGIINKTEIINYEHPTRLYDIYDKQYVEF